jgi:DNA-binding transcriptional ArsR family regulator
MIEVDLGGGSPLDEHVSSDLGIDQRLLRLASEPLRLRTLTILSERPAGVGEIAEALGMSPSEAGEHLRQMHAAGLVEPAGEVLGHRAIEPSYRAVLRVLWSDEEWAELSVAERRRVSAWIVHAINAEVCEALESGTFNSRTDAHTSHTVSMVDEEGWLELSRIHAEALEAILATKAASAERLADRGEEGVRVISGMICGELPPTPQQPRLEEPS